MDYKVKLKIDGINALWHCYTSVLNPKGRSELRDHAKVTRAIKKCCTEGDALKFKKEAELLLDEDRLKYVVRSVKETIEKPVPGALAEGYDELLEALEEAEKAANIDPTK
jgi:hypothetical protein